MAENNEIILDIKINTDEVAQKLATATKQVDLLKQEQQNLTKAFKEGRIADVAYAKAMAESKAELEKANREVKASTALLQAETMARVDDTMSLDEQRQALNAAQKAYGLLSGEAKEAADAEGGLRDQIKALSDAVKSSEQSLGDARRNVGNYTESINQAFGGIGEAMEKAGDSANSLSPAINALKGMGGDAKKAGDALDMIVKVMQLVGNAGKAMTAATKAQTTATQGATIAQEGLNTAMAANPIGLVATAIATLLPLIQSFISETNDASAAQDKFNEQLKAIEDGLYYESRAMNRHLKLMAIDGKSEVEIAEERVRLTKEQWEKAIKDYNDFGNAMNSMDDEEREAAKKKRDKLEEIMNASLKVYQDANDELLFVQEKAKRDRIKKAEEEADQAKNLADQLKADLADSSKVLAELLAPMPEDVIEIWDKAEAAAKKKAKEWQEAVLADGEEETDESDIDAMVADTFGFDEEALALYNDLLAQGVDAHEAAARAIEDMARRAGDAATAEMEKWLNQAMEFANQFAELSNALADAEMQTYQNEQDQKLKALDARLKKGLISEKEYNKQKEAIEAQTQRAENEAALKKAKQDKALAIMQAIISTAVGIAKAVSENPMMGGLPGSAIAAAMGAIQIGTIAAQPLPQFATGGVVSGTSYTGDNVLARVNSGEMILNKQQQARLFDAISGGNWQTLGVDYEALALAVSNTPAPVVVYSELQEFGQKTTQYNEIASI